jgi:hypothetical protein
MSALVLDTDIASLSIKDQLPSRMQDRPPAHAAEAALDQVEKVLTTLGRAFVVLRLMVDVLTSVDA